MKKSIPMIGIVGAGAWGTALAQMAAVAGNQVNIFCRNKAVTQEINSFHSNKKYLGDRKLSADISAIDISKNLDIAMFSRCDLLILAVPAQATRGFLRALGSKNKPPMPVVLTAKGFERQTLALQSQILQQEWEQAIPLILSGPSFAVDVAAKKPTAITLAAQNAAVLQMVAKKLASKTFRPYSSNDPKGVELCGGLKNIYALASGAIEGADLGLSARSAFISRAVIEMGRIVAAMGGKTASVNGLAGVGDLVLSCTSDQSRNYRFGVELGKGKSVDQIMDQGLGLAEGVASTSVAHRMVEQGNIEAPLVGAINQLLGGEENISHIVEQLMTRPLKSEG